MSWEGHDFSRADQCKTRSALAAGVKLCCAKHVEILQTQSWIESIKNHRDPIHPARIACRPRVTSPHRKRPKSTVRNGLGRACRQRLRLRAGVAEKILPGIRRHIQKIRLRHQTSKPPDATAVQTQQWIAHG